MNKTLVLFAFSRTVDTYVNVIASTYNKIDQLSQSRDRLEQVILVRINNATTSLEDSEVNALFNQIWIQIRKLSQGKYITDFVKQEEENLFDINTVNIYEKINALDC